MGRGGGRGPQLPKQMKEMLSESGASQSLKFYGGRRGNQSSSGSRGKSQSAPPKSKNQKTSHSKTLLSVKDQPQAAPATSQDKKRKLGNDLPPREPPAKKSKPAATTTTKPTPSAKKKTALEKLLDAQNQKQASQTSKGGGSSKRKATSAAEAQEDLEIAWLEAQLGKRGGGGGKDDDDGEDEDGLDDLLGDLDDVEAALGWKDARPDRASRPVEEDEEEDETGSEEEEDDDDDDEEDDNGSDLSADEDDDDWSGIEEELMAQEHSAEEEDDTDEDDGEDSDSAPPTAQPEPMATTKTAYVPPHLRQKPAQSDAPTASTSATTSEPPPDPRLDRLISSHLNKLSPANLPQIHSALSALYTDSPDFSRAAVCAALVRLLLIRLDAKDALGEVQVLCFAALVGGLKNVREGVLVESLKRFDRHVVELPAAAPDSKASANLVRFWARLYNLGVVSCNYIYGLIRELVARLKEDDVEQLLLLLKVSGQQLRSDDPTSLKEIAQLVSDRAKSEDLSSRTKFMIETLTNLKHNRPAQKNTTDGGLADTEEQFKKHLKKSASHLDTLSMSLNELRQAESRGKWWVVGNAWAGNPLVEHQQQQQQQQEQASLSSLSKDKGSTSANEEQKWAKLARKQGMNTTVRQGIFVALMGAEDYVDAVDRLAGLGLTEVQQREIVRVILHCSGHEKTYNPYYTLVLQRLLSTNHSHAITTQYALWDLFREMGESSVGGHERLKNVSESSTSSSGRDLGKRRAKNLERLFGWVLAKGGLNLGVLKPLPFYNLKRSSKSFLLGVLRHLFLSSQSNSPLQLTTTVHDPSALEEVFVKILNTPTAQGLAQVVADMVESSEDEFEKKMGEAALEVLDLGSGIARDVDRLR